MTVRSLKLFGPATVTGTVAVLYTVPTGVTAVLKDLWVWPNLATVTGLDLFVNGTGAAQHIAHVMLANNGDARLTGLFLCLEPGDTLRAATSGSGNATVLGSGAKLAGVAP